MIKKIVCMELSQTLKVFFSFALLIGGILIILQVLGLLDPFVLFTWLSYAFFVILTTLTLYFASLAVKMSNPNKGLYAIFGAMGVKFILSLTLIIPYALIVKPPITFVIPFFILYIPFTICETNLLLKMKSRNKVN